MNSLSDRVYKLLYDKSTLSEGSFGIRVCNEDEWPIDEIVKLIHEESRDALAQGRQFVAEAERNFYQIGYNDGKGLPAKKEKT